VNDVAVKFNARIDAFVPGNFVSWVIIPIPGEKTPKIENDYELANTEVAMDALRVTVSQESAFSMPKINGHNLFENAVFEIEKTAPKRYKVVRLVGYLKVEYKIEPTANMTVREASGQDTQLPVKPKPDDRFNDAGLLED
jgi:hypothetical protein